MNLKEEFQGIAEGIKEGVGGLVEGLGQAFDAIQASPTLNDMANHGRTEAAAALFSGSAYVMYQRGSHDQPTNDNHMEVPSVEVHEPEITQSRGIHM